MGSGRGPAEGQGERACVVGSRAVWWGFPPACWAGVTQAGAANCHSLEGCGLLSRLDRQTQATTLVHQIFGGYLRSRGR